MNFQVRLSSTPTSNNEASVAVATGLNTLMFPGCAVPDFTEDYLWLVYTDAGEVAGFGSLRPLTGVNAGTAYLDRVGILRRFRGHKLQKRLIRARLSLARKLGIKTVITYTVADNYPSINSLMHSGFSMYSPEHAWAGREMVYFRIDL